MDAYLGGGGGVHNWHAALLNGGEVEYMPEPAEEGYTLNDFIAWNLEHDDGNTDQLASFLEWHDTEHANATLESFVTWYNQEHGLTGGQTTVNNDDDNAIIGILDNLLGRDDNPLETYVFAEVAGTIEA